MRPRIVCSASEPRRTMCVDVYGNCERSRDSKETPLRRRTKLWSCRRSGWKSLLTRPAGSSTPIGAAARGLVGELPPVQLQPEYFERAGAVVRQRAVTAAPRLQTLLKDDLAVRYGCQRSRCIERSLPAIRRNCRAARQARVPSDAVGMALRPNNSKRLSRSGPRDMKRFHQSNRSSVDLR